MLGYSFCSCHYFQKLKDGMGSNPQLSEVVDSVFTLLKEYPFKDPDDKYVLISDDLTSDNTKHRDTLLNAILTEGSPIKTMDKVFGVLFGKVPVIVVTDPSDNPTVITHQARVKTLESMLGLPTIELRDSHY